MNDSPIGVLDSGLGGLSIAREIKKILPDENIAYFGDSANIPYSTKSDKEILELSREIMKLLLNKNAKVIVVACNTITVVALKNLRKEFSSIPLIGTVPVIKTAANLTKNGRIGIFSTKKTSQSQYQKSLINKFAKTLNVLNLGSDEIVPLIEKGENTENILKKELNPFKKFGVDVLALGCTHFPLVKPTIDEVMGPKVVVIDSGAAVAKQVKKVLEKNNDLSSSPNEDVFYTTGNSRILEDTAKDLGLLGSFINLA